MVDAQRITGAYNNMPEVYTNPLPPELVMRDDVNDELSIPAGMARLNVLSFTGLSPRKYGIIRRSQADRIEIAFEDGRKMNLSLLEPISNVVYQIERTKQFYVTAEEKFLIQAGKIKQNVEKGTDLAVNLALYAFMPALVVKITAEVIRDTINEAIGDYDSMDRSSDMRMGLFFPGRAWVGGINLRPGDYSFTVNYYQGEEVIKSRKVENYRVEAGKLNLIEDFCLDYVVDRRPNGYLYDDDRVGNSNNGSDKEPLPDYAGRLPAATNFKAENVTVNVRHKNQWNITEKWVGTYPEVTWDPVPGAIAYWVYVKDIYRRDEDVYLFKGRVIEPSYINNWPFAYSMRVIAFGNEGFGVPSEVFEVGEKKDYQKKETDRVYYLSY